MYLTKGIKAKVGLYFLVLACSAAGESIEADHAYPSGFSLAMRLGGDLHDALPQKFFDQLDAQAIALQPLNVPLIAPVAVTADNRVQRQVEMSAGFIDLVNHLCHAKAIDRVRKGFFDQYVSNLSQTCLAHPDSAAPPIDEPAYWTADILNDETSYFNQMIGMMMAINMAHHYLGHYAKYSSKLIGPGAKILPINDFLTPAEWDTAVKAGALDALNCALSTDGLRVIFEAIDKMPVRPAWAAYIAPAGIDLKKLNKELARYEEDFFHGRIKN